MALPDKKTLIVEGEDDKFAVIMLMAEYIAWGNERKDWPVVVAPCGSYTVVLKPGYISAQIKSREIEIFGLLIDADDEFDTRWNKIRNQSKPFFPDIPEALPPEGLVLQNDEGKRLGLWMMPDNRSHGMIETFLCLLVPADTAAIWDLSKHAVEEARKAGAKFKECHRDKANIHTWLAWQEPPGESFGRAIMKNILNNRSPHALPFVEWFRRLYEL